jgi:hypothetical protein
LIYGSTVDIFINISQIYFWHHFFSSLPCRVVITKYIFHSFLLRLALIVLRNYINQTFNPSDSLQQVLQRKTAHIQDSLVQMSSVEDAIHSIGTSTSPTHHVFGFQQAFEIPEFSFDSSERTLIRCPKPTSIFGTAPDKFSIFHERYQILKICRLHTHLFQAFFFLNDDWFSPEFRRR